MTRRHVTFECDGETLVGTLDEGDRGIGLLIVTGGNELRAGAFSGQAEIARKLAGKGFPVFRFDRRGVGDSGGENRGFRSAGPDIAAAFATFREQAPGLRRIAAYGLCDGAAALLLNGGSACDALVLANPWTMDADEGQNHSPSAIRQRYGAKLANPREWLRAARGGVSLRKLGRGIKRAIAHADLESDLLTRLRKGALQFDGRIRFLVSGRDRAGLHFAMAWGEDERVSMREGADHAFSSEADHAWLREQLLAALQEQARQLDMR